MAGHAEGVAELGQLRDLLAGERDIAGVEEPLGGAGDPCLETRDARLGPSREGLGGLGAVEAAQDLCGAAVHGALSGRVIETGRRSDAVDALDDDYPQFVVHREQARRPIGDGRDPVVIGRDLALEAEPLRVTLGHHAAAGGGRKLDDDSLGEIPRVIGHDRDGPHRPRGGRHHLLVSRHGRHLAKRPPATALP